MSVLVLVEHDNADINPATLNAISAGLVISDDVHLLVAGKDCAGVGEAAVQIAGVKKVNAIKDGLIILIYMIKLFFFKK